MPFFEPATINLKWNEVPSGLVNGSNVVFTLANTPSVSDRVLLSLNGLLQRQPDDYTVSGSTITFVTAPIVGDTLRATYEY